ncbi:hypothetical protein [Streptomyces avermitilis]|uniref:hypothetical protein n=1 Tax=Streptomyces avermitilis TaxID=33903 RepID=UPI000A9C9B42|nr:hypothetical protein [Streptomyces avermitilis]
MIQMNGPTGSLPPSGAGGAAPAFRLGALQIAAPILGGLVAGTALAYVLVEATGGHMTAGELWSWVSATVIASVVVPSLSPRYGVELTHNQLVLLGGGRRKIAWQDIVGMEIRKTAGIRTVVVQVSDGRRTPLRAPMSLLDRGFDDKAQVLTGWWAARRGGPDRV